MQVLKRRNYDLKQKDINNVIDMFWPLKIFRTRAVLQSNLGKGELLHNQVKGYLAEKRQYHTL